MASQVSNYKCPNCNGSMKFDAASGKVICEYCESEFNVSEVEELYRKSDAAASEVFSDQTKKEEAGDVDETVLYGSTKAEDSGTWDGSNISSDWGSDSASMRAYTCPSCGAGLMCDSSTAATSCPYCGNQTIIPGQFSEELKPDYIIPFKITPEQAKEALKNHYKGKLLLPRNFKDENHIKEMKGIYVPFWLFNGKASGEAVFHATIEEVHEHAKSTEYITHHYNVYRSGTMNFEKVPTDASIRMPDAVMDSVEPFEYKDLKDFSTAYLPGYLADRYDVTIEECSDRADLRCKNTLIHSLRDTVTGYASVTETKSSAAVARGKVHYALLPVYMLRTVYKNKDYIFAVNGQTGKSVGNMPSSVPRMIASSSIGFIIGCIIVFFILTLFG